MQLHNPWLQYMFWSETFHFLQRPGQIWECAGMGGGNGEARLEVPLSGMRTQLDNCQLAAVDRLPGLPRRMTLVPRYSQRTCTALVLELHQSGTYSEPSDVVFVFFGKPHRLEWRVALRSLRLGVYGCLRP